MVLAEPPRPPPPPIRKVLDLTMVDPELRGFAGGFAAGHWGYLVPFKNKEPDSGFSGKMVRIDLRTFDYAGVTVRCAFDIAIPAPPLRRINLPATCAYKFRALPTIVHRITSINFLFFFFVVV